MEHLRTALDRFHRVDLGSSLTAIEPLARLEAALGDQLRGVRLFAKREDVAGLGGGGNKLRKLEFLLGEAMSEGADAFTAIGGRQSNFARLGVVLPGAATINVRGDERGPGYGIPTSGMIEAIRMLVSTEGLLLDPVNSGKAFAGLLRAVRSGEFRPGASVLFVMAGGTPGLFAYRTAFERRAGRLRVVCASRAARHMS